MNRCDTELGLGVGWFYKLTSPNLDAGTPTYLSLKIDDSFKSTFSISAWIAHNCPDFPLVQFPPTVTSPWHRRGQPYSLIPVVSMGGNQSRVRLCPNYWAALRSWGPGNGQWCGRCWWIWNQHAVADLNGSTNGKMLSENGRIWWKISRGDWYTSI